MGIQTGQTPVFVLASASPRRAQLLSQLGLPFEIHAADLDESLLPGEGAAPYVERIARAKAAAVAKRKPGSLVVGADTSVVLDGSVLGKPADDADAARMLRALSGRSHQVLTAVALAGTSTEARVVETQVAFRSLSPEEIAWYVSTGEPRDKAGAYALQGAGGAFVSRVEGSVSNVIGLPLAETLALLQRAGVTWPLPMRGSPRG